MDPVSALVPAEHAGEHLLVVPVTSPLAAGAPAGQAVAVPALASAWFPDVGWMRPPVAAAPPPARGARFRGIRPAGPATAQPGELRIGTEHRAVGPFEVDAAGVEGFPGGRASVWAIGRADGTRAPRGPRPASYDDRDGLVRVFATGLPTGEELTVVRWAVSAARKRGGLLVVDGGQPLRPDPASGVELVVWTRASLADSELAALVRTVLASAQPVAPAAAPAGAETSSRVVARTPYDGDVVVDAQVSSVVPRAVGETEGTFVAYRLWWAPQDPYELQVERPSGLHVIARARARALVARLAAAFVGQVGGLVLDDDGFLVDDDELAWRLTAERAGARAWV